MLFCSIQDAENIKIHGSALLELPKNVQMHKIKLTYNHAEITIALSKVQMHQINSCAHTPRSFCTTHLLEEGR